MNPSSAGGGGGGSWGGDTSSDPGRAKFYEEANKIYSALARGEVPYGGAQNAIDSLYATYGQGSGVSYQEAAGIIQQAYNANPYQGTSTSGGGTAAPNNIIGDLSGKIAALNQLYDLLSNDAGTLAQSRRSDLEKQYGKQTEDLTGQYEKNQATMPWAFVSKGTRNSSDYENTARDAGDTYTRGIASIDENKQNNLAQVGQQYQQALSGFQAAKSNLAGTNPSFYGTQGDYQATLQGYDQQANKLAADRSGFMTNSQYAQALNGIAPVQNTSTSALQEQLAKITNSSIPGYAKDTIAKGLIKQSGQDPAYYQDYYEKIKGGLSTPLQ